MVIVVIVQSIRNMMTDIFMSHPALISDDRQLLDGFDRYLSFLHPITIYYNILNYYT